MLQSPLFRRAIALFALLFMVGADVAAHAEKPFIPYPAYGSSRGRIRYVDGVLRNKQRIHWGNGITDNGVLVMRDLAAAAGQILPVVLPRGAAGPEEEGQKPRGMPEAIDGKTDFQWQSEADGIRQANQGLLATLKAGRPIEIGKKPPGSDGTVVVDGSKGMRVLIIYEVKDRLILTDEQRAVLNSTKIKEYLNTHCAKNSNGDAEWRMWDNDYEKDKVLSLTNNDATWWERYEAARKAYGERPALIVYKDEKKVIDQELTDGENETLELLQQVGGP